MNEIRVVVFLEEVVDCLKVGKIKGGLFTWKV